MKKNEVREYQKKSLSEIEKSIIELQEKLAKVKLELKRGEVKNVHEGRNLRRSLAQLMTLKTISLRKEQA